MKRALATAAIIAATAAGIIAGRPAAPVQAEPVHPENVYPETLYVIQIDEDRDEVRCRTFSGFVYAFYGVEDWQEGNIVSAIMNTNGTPDTIIDDYFEMIRYSGWID